MNLSQYVERHDRYLQQLIAKQKIPAERIREAMLYMLFSGGKRIRPLLVYLSGEAFSVPLEILDVLAAAIEMIHTYSLIHDDLPAMDNDDYRRGKLTCHKAFDEATAILTGDALQALAPECLITELQPYLSADKTLQIIKILLSAMGAQGMISGQSLDLELLSQSTVSEKTLEKIHQLKTGRLICACFQMVLVAADATSEEQNLIRQFGEHLGLVFQMQDDFLDAFDSSLSLGKNRSSDQSNGKTTFATLYDASSLKDNIQTIFTHLFQLLSALNIEKSNESWILFLKKLQHRTHPEGETS